MQELKEWVAAIAGMVVFASLLELLAPSGSMKRYVQLTTGLLILLTLLKPVLGVVKGTRNLVWETEAAWVGSGLSLDRVMAQADQIRQAGLERQTRLYRERLESAAAQAASGVLAGWRVRAEAVLGPAAGPDQAPPLQKVVLTVTPGGDRRSGDGAASAEGRSGERSAGGGSAGGGSAPGTGLMTPVQPVDIHVGLSTGGGAATAADVSGVTAGEDGGSAGSARLNASQAAAARRAVAEALSIALGQVEIKSDSIRE